MRPVLAPSSLSEGRRRRPKLLVLQVLPTLVTLGNVLAGFLALSFSVEAWRATDPAVRELFWTRAAWAVVFGMVCDALDGRVARLTGVASSFGAELDSLADMITFGVAPALLAKSVVQTSFPDLSTKVATALAMVYVLGAALRLARYNVESNRVQEPGHVTRVFRGLPSPGAAGVVAALVLFRHEYGGGDWAWLRWVFLLAPPLLGLLMVSRFAYSHAMNRYLEGARSPLAIVVLVVIAYLALQNPEASLAVVFCAYAVSGPVLFLARAAFGRPRWIDDEDADEEVVEPDEGHRP